MKKTEATLLEAFKTPKLVYCYDTGLVYTLGRALALGLDNCRLIDIDEVLHLGLTIETAN